MITLKLPDCNIDLDFDLKYSEKGMNLEVKKFNINDFNIDKVFKRFDKKYGKKDKPKIIDTKEFIEDTNDDNECYVINIQ